MRVIVQDTLKGLPQQRFSPGRRGFTIGRALECDIVLESRFVADRHATVERSPHGWTLCVLSGARSVDVEQSGETLSVAPGHSSSLDLPSRLTIGTFTIGLVDDQPSEEESKVDAEIDELISALHSDVLAEMELEGLDGRMRLNQSTIDRVSVIVDRVLEGRVGHRLSGLGSQARLAMLTMAVGREMLNRIYPPTPDNRAAQLRASIGVNQVLEAEWSREVSKIAMRVGISLDTRGSEENLLVLETNLAEAVAECRTAITQNVRSYAIRRYMLRVLADSMFGFGPLQDLLELPDVSEIMVVHRSLIYIERGGQVIRTRRSFPSDDVLEAVIERIVAPIGRRIDRSQPLVDARLPDGSRVNAVVPPVALRGPCLTIRRFPSKRLTMKDLLSQGTVTTVAAALLEAAVLSRQNISSSSSTQRRLWILWSNPPCAAISSSSARSPLCPKGLCPMSWAREMAAVRSSLTRRARASTRSAIS